MAVAAARAGPKVCAWPATAPARIGPAIWPSPYPAVNSPMTPADRPGAICPASVSVRAEMPMKVPYARAEPAQPSHPVDDGHQERPGHDVARPFEEIRREEQGQRRARSAIRDRPSRRRRRAPIVGQREPAPGGVERQGGEEGQREPLAAPSQRACSLTTPRSVLH